MTDTTRQAEPGTLGHAKVPDRAEPAGHAKTYQRILAEYEARGVPLPTDQPPSLEHAPSQRRAEPNKD